VHDAPSHTTLSSSGEHSANTAGSLTNDHTRSRAAPIWASH
jgi:hypothetical protein